MAHLSLYRRFRPDNFDQIVRQEHVVRILKNQIETGAIGHAYLFTGPRGTGKTTAARIFARAVNCAAPKNGSPCGKCPSCLALAAGSLDVIEIDAASNNGVGEMRDLREKVQYPPVSGKYKVFIVDEVHMLTESAFNALLKTLEEPPAHAIFILATTEPHKLPATILSRCMRLDFTLIPEEDLEAHLIRILEEIGKPYEREAVAAIARAGAGSDRDMLSIAETCLAYGDKLTYTAVTEALGTADHVRTCALVRAVLSAKTGEALESVETLLDEGKAAGVLLRDVLQFLHRITIAKICRSAEKMLSLPQSLFREVKSVADEADGRTILRATEIFAKAESDLRFTTSPRIILEAAVLRASMPSADSDTDALLLRIDALEKRLSALEEGRSAAPASSRERRREREEAEPLEEPVYEPFPEEPLPEEPFPEEPAPVPASAPVREQTPVPAQEPVGEQTPASAPVPSGTEDVQTLFGKFMRMLRKNSKSGVLFTMCSDLEPSMENGVLILSSPSETIVRSLKRQERTAAISQALAGIGITAFEIRSKREDRRPAALEELRQDFGDYPIEIK